MESLFLSSGSNAANISFQMRAIRKMGAVIQAPGDANTYKSLWADLFIDFDTDRTIHIEVAGTANEHRQLWISLADQRLQDITFGKEGRVSGGFPQIKFTWKRGAKQPIVSKPTATNTGLQFGSVPVENFPMIWFHPSAGDGPDEVAKRFSELSKTGEITPVVDALIAEFDFLQDISIEFFSGLPILFATSKGSKTKLPLGLISDGIQRLLSILIGIVYFKNGVVLIDQLEDGFYFDRLPSIWKILHGFAIEFNVQLFVSSHSRECLSSLTSTVQGNDEDFCLLRAERGNRSCELKQFDGQDLLAALEQKVEFR